MGGGGNKMKRWESLLNSNSKLIPFCFEKMGSQFVLYLCCGSLLDLPCSQCYSSFHSSAVSFVSKCTALGHCSFQWKNIDSFSCEHENNLPHMLIPLHIKSQKQTHTGLVLLISDVLISEFFFSSSLFYPHMKTSNKSTKDFYVNPLHQVIYRTIDFKVFFMPEWNSLGFLKAHLKTDIVWKQMLSGRPLPN